MNLVERSHAFLRRFIIRRRRSISDFPIKIPAWMAVLCGAKHASLLL